MGVLLTSMDSLHICRKSSSQGRFPVERRLAAILVADAVDYSRLIPKETACSKTVTTIH